MFSNLIILTVKYIFIRFVHIFGGFKMFTLYIHVSCFRNESSYAEWGYSRAIHEMSSIYLLTRRVEKTTSIPKQILYRIRVQKPRILYMQIIKGRLRGLIPVKCSCINLLSKNSISRSPFVSNCTFPLG